MFPRTRLTPRPPPKGLGCGESGRRPGVEGPGTFQPSFLSKTGSVSPQYVDGFLKRFGFFGFRMVGRSPLESRVSPQVDLEAKSRRAVRGADLRW